MPGGLVPISFPRRVLLGSLPAGLASILSAQKIEAAPALSLVLVTAANTSLQNISQGNLRQLFLGETIRDAAGNKLVPLNLPPESAERELFDRRVLGMSPDEMARYWIDQKVRGLKGAPRNLSPPQMVARVVERFPGAVAYLRPDQVLPSLQQVEIDANPPGSARYPLVGDGK